MTVAVTDLPKPIRSSRLSFTLVETDWMATSILVQASHNRLLEPRDEWPGVHTEPTARGMRPKGMQASKYNRYKPDVLVCEILCGS